MLTYLTALIAALLSAFGFGPTPPDPQPAPSPSPSASPEEHAMDTYVVMLADPPGLTAEGRNTPEGRRAIREHTAEVVERYEAMGVEVTRTYSSLGGFAGRMTSEQRAAAELDPDVQSIEENTEMSTAN